MAPVAYFAVLLLLAINDNSKHAVEGAIGMNWGRQSTQRLIPSTVVDLLLQNGIKEARIFTSEDDILKAFVGSGIKLTLTNYNVKAITSLEDAKAWVDMRAPYVVPANIRRVILGNNPFFFGLSDPSSLDRALNAMEYTQYAFIGAGCGQVKVTLPTPYLVLKDNVTRPSEAEFRDDIKEQIIRFLRFIQAHRTPLVLDFFPLHYTEYKKFDPSFAFADNKSVHVDDVNGAVYTNAFEFFIDSFAWALQKVNASDVEIVIGQVGWPTDGYQGANASAAEYFYKYFLPLVASNKGTPMRPGKPINIYIHSLSDENQNPFFPFARHWGIYRSNGEPKYKIDLSGQGRDMFPFKARGIMRMPERWCVLNQNKRFDTDVLTKQNTKACEKGDCTSLAKGGSCSGLDPNQKISYAFNMYFQASFQANDGCDFQGYGMVVTDNPSTDTCVFPVEPVQGQQAQFKLSDGGSQLHDYWTAAIFQLLLSSVLLALLLF